MGIFQDYDIDIDSVKESSFDVNDGTYRFTIAEADTRDGTKNFPDNVYFLIDYQLEDENGDSVGSKSEWFTLEEDGRTDTKKVETGLRMLKSRLLSLGLKGAQLQEFDGSEIDGLTGVLTLKSTVSKNNGNTYQNVRNLRVDQDEETEEVEEEAPKAKAKPAATKAAPAKPAAAKKPAPKAKAEESDGDDDDNPFGQG